MEFEIIVDNFAGGGGASTGIELAVGRPVDLAINHDPAAIAMHRMNHPYTKHYCESVWDVNPTAICGGKPVSKNIRGLAWIAARWAATVKPRVIILENVPELKTWGRLGKDGKPNPRYSGETFHSFVRTLESCGYKVEWKELKACDYGAPTIRTRFFLIARCDGKPIVFPQPTHGERLIPYRTAAECIDWSIPRKPIFGREKPLAKNTLRRIARGLDKFTIKSDKPFILNYKFDNEPEQVDMPMSTITAVNSHYIAASHISKYFGGVIGSPVTAPLGTVTAVDHNCLTTASLIPYHSEQGASEVRGQAFSQPLMTVDSSNRYALTAAHIIKYYSGDPNSAANAPLGTITTKERHGLIESHLCVLRNNQDCKPLTEPMPTLCTRGGHIAEIRTTIAKYNSSESFGNWAEIRGLLNEYCGYTLADNEILLLEISGEQYYISDIGMRMLTPRELYRAQGFPDDYIIEFDVNGKAYSRSAQVARCGNAVPPPFAEALVRENLPEMCGRKYTLMSELKEAL